MPVLVEEPLPAELEALLERRRQTGADRYDEVWQGVLHMIPPPSHVHERLLLRLGHLIIPYVDAAGLDATGGIGLGDADDFVVPDIAIHRADAAPQWHPTAALVIEILSPNDRTPEKLSFYAAHNVDEVLIIDPFKRTVDWLALDGDQYKPIDRSRLIDLGAAALAAQIDWPPTGD